MDNAEYWKRIKAESEASIMSLFGVKGSISIKETINKDYDSIETEEDADSILTYILDHAISTHEKTRGILSICKWFTAHLHLRERKEIETTGNK